MADEDHGTEGFSLIELMIVVAIMAILASLAIQAFYGALVWKTKTSEATANLSAIRTGEEAYRSENDVYLSAGAYPAAVPPASGILWADTEATGFKDIGFAADGIVRFSYTVTATAPTAVAPAYFTATANSDMDDDGISATYVVSNNPAETAVDSRGRIAPNVYPKAIHDSASDDY